jgi:hypothetical protein
VTRSPADALQGLIGQQQALDEGVEARLGVLARAVAAGRPHRRAAADLVSFLTREVPALAAAEEATLRAAAGMQPGLAETVAAMAADYPALAEGAAHIASAPDGLAALGRADAAAARFSAHVVTVRDVLLLAAILGGSRPG